MKCLSRTVRVVQLSYRVIIKNTKVHFAGLQLRNKMDINACPNNNPTNILVLMQVGTTHIETW